MKLGEGHWLAIASESSVSFRNCCQRPSPIPDPAGSYYPPSERGGHSTILPSGSFIIHEPVPGPLGAICTCGVKVVVVVVVVVLVVVYAVVVVVTVESSTLGTNRSATTLVKNITSTAITTMVMYATKFLVFSLIFLLIF